MANTVCSTSLASVPLIFQRGIANDKLTFINDNKMTWDMFPEDKY